MTDHRAIALAAIDQRVELAHDFLTENADVLDVIATNLAQIEFPLKRKKAMGLLFAARPAIIPIIAETLLVLGMDTYAQRRLTRIETP